MKDIQPERRNKLRKLAARRQFDVQIILENVRDLHNVGAVLRTCDAVGIPAIHMILDSGFKKSKLRMGKNTSAGARRWVDAYLHEDIESCLGALRTDRIQILGTAITPDAKSIYDIDFTIPTMLVFGNERDGLSDEALKLIDQSIAIPQQGMVQSLNISVACAVTLYELMRQRLQHGMYADAFTTSAQEELFNRFLEEHKKRNFGHVKKWPSQ